jgi:hypothetical protein
MQFGRKSTQKKWIVQIFAYKNAFFEKKLRFFWSIQKKAVPLQPISCCAR